MTDTAPGHQRAVVRGPSRMRAVLALALVVVGGCATRARDGERELHADLARRAWPATSVLVVERGQVQMSLGHRTPAGRNPQDLVYPLGSISKMFTAAALHRLAEREAIDLQAPVARYLADWPPSWQGVRVYQLLGHTSGVPDFWFVAEAARLVTQPTARAGDLWAVMIRQPLQFAPGSRFSYSNTAYQAAARLVERVTGTAYDTFLTREFFKPLAMSSMRHCRGDRSEMPGHVLTGGRLQPVPTENYDTARGDGGLCGSARDLARWFDGLANGTVGKGATWEQYLAPSLLSDGSRVAYAHGLSLRPFAALRKVGHHGAMAGHSGMVAWYPDREVIIVVLTSVGGVSADAVEQSIAAARFGVAAPRPIEGDAPLSHAGRFDVGPLTLTLERRGRALWLRSPPPGPSGRLERVGPATYVMDGDPWGVSVHLDCAEQRCVSLRLHMAGMEWPGRRVDE